MYASLARIARPYEEARINTPASRREVPSCLFVGDRGGRHEGGRFATVVTGERTPTDGFALFPFERREVHVPQGERGKGVAHEPTRSRGRHPATGRRFPERLPDSSGIPGEGRRLRADGRGRRGLAGSAQDAEERRGPGLAAR